MSVHLFVVSNIRALALQTIRHDWLLCRVQQSDPRLRDGHESEKQRVPFGMLCVSTMQPQVSNFDTENIICVRLMVHGAKHQNLTSRKVDAYVKHHS